MSEPFDLHQFFPQLVQTPSEFYPHAFRFSQNEQFIFQALNTALNPSDLGFSCFFASIASGIRLAIRLLPERKINYEMLLIAYKRGHLNDPDKMIEIEEDYALETARIICQHFKIQLYVWIAPHTAYEFGEQGHPQVHIYLYNHHFHLLTRDKSSTNVTETDVFASKSFIGRHEWHSTMARFLNNEVQKENVQLYARWRSVFESRFEKFDQLMQSFSFNMDKIDRPVIPIDLEVDRKAEVNEKVNEVESDPLITQQSTVKQRGCLSLFNCFWN